MTEKIFLLAMTMLIITVSSEAGTFKYDPHGKRDPFVPLIGQERPSASVSFAEIASIDDARLEGIATGQYGTRTAIINGEMVREGFKAGEVEVKKIGKDSVVILLSGKDYTLKLYEEEIGGVNSEQ